MRKILFVALLLVCITAKKHHKQEDGGEAPQEADPMAECFEHYCENQALKCIFDDKCQNTFETRHNPFGDYITPEDVWNNI